MYQLIKMHLITKTFKWKHLKDKNVLIMYYFYKEVEIRHNIMSSKSFIHVKIGWE